MKKTTVYLEDEEAERLRDVSIRTGKPQAELIREGVRHILDQAPKRTFHSMGKGRGPSYERWGGDVEALYDWVMGRREP